MCLKGEGILLVADDDLDDQILIGEVIALACPSIGMKFVDNGAELIDCLRQSRDQGMLPSLVLLDLNMPRKDGRTALREIKSDPKLAGIPVVVLTTSSAEEDELACRREGADDYFRKPANLKDYERMISDLCSQYF